MTEGKKSSNGQEYLWLLLMQHVNKSSQIFCQFPITITLWCFLWQKGKNSSNGHEFFVPTLNAESRNISRIFWQLLIADWWIYDMLCDRRKSSSNWKESGVIYWLWKTIIGLWNVNSRKKSSNWKKSGVFYWLLGQSWKTWLIMNVSLGRDYFASNLIIQNICASIVPHPYDFPWWNFACTCAE